jgi:hypothetical protein
MQSDGKSSHGLWPGELKINQSINQSNINHLLLNNKVCVAAFSSETPEPN